jgi:hypothetical protein
MRRSKGFVAMMVSMLLLLAPVAAIAQDEQGLVTIVEKDEPAPFGGVLMTEDVAAKMASDLEFAERECQLRIDQNVTMTVIEHDAKLARCELLRQTEVERLNGLLNIKQERIDFLEKRWTPVPWYETPVFWHAAGIAVGIVLTTGTAYLLFNVNN